MSNHEEEREKLRAIQAQFEKAVENNTINDLRSFIDPDFSFVSFTDRSFSDFDSFIRQWDLTREEMVGSGSFSTRLDPEPALFTEDTAICHGNATNHMIDRKGHTYDFTSHWTVVFRRREGEWRIVRAHNSLDPFSNPMLKHGVKTILVKSGLAAFVLGGAVCSALTYLILS